MTDKERYIKQAFKHYNENRKRLKELSFESVRAVDYTQPRFSKGAPKGDEGRLVSFLNLKTGLEKQIAIVDKVLLFYEMEGGGKDEYIRLRWLKGHSTVSTALNCFISEKTARRWEKEIFERAARAADLFNLWTV